MSIPQAFKTAKPRVHRRREIIATSPPPPPPAPAHVLSVRAESEGSENAVWTFDTPVLAIGDAQGLIFTDTRAIFSAAVSGEYTITAETDDVVQFGDGWLLDASVALIVFANGATIADASGTVAD